MSQYTAKQIKAAADALFIDEGACNVAGIANALHEAACAWLEAESSTDKANTCAPVRIIMHQLSWLVFKTDTMPHEDWIRAREECKKIACSGL